MRKAAGFLAAHGPARAQPSPDEQQPQQHPFEKIAEELGKLVREKNDAYGSAYALCATFLELLFPGGVHVDRYTDMLLLVRMFDKQMRIARRKDAFGESPYKDLAGYSVLGIHKDTPFEKKKEGDTSCPTVGEQVSG